MDPPLTTVRVDCMALARRATEMVFALLRHPTGRALTPIVVNTELVVRESVAAPPKEDGVHPAR